MKRKKRSTNWAKIALSKRIKAKRKKEVEDLIEADKTAKAIKDRAYDQAQIVTRVDKDKL